MLSTLAAENIISYLNSRTAQDPECLPVMRELSKIHVFEEARHRGYAHEYLKQSWPQAGTFKRSMARRYGLGTEMVAALPSLRFRQAIAVGKAFRSGLPVIFEVPEITEQGASEAASGSPAPATIGTGQATCSLARRGCRVVR
jgi:hypothetical protein